MTQDLTAIQVRHVAKASHESMWCSYCKMMWPCDTARVLEEVAAIESMAVMDAVGNRDYYASR